MLKEDWKHCLLGEALTFQRGFDITKKEQREGLYQVFSSSGPKSTHVEYKIKGPGVIIGRKGTLGSVFFTNDNYWPHDTTLWVKDFHGNDPKFAYYFIQTMGFEKLDVGAANPSLNRNHIHTISVRYPTPPTQRKIAAILSAYDDLIENNLRRIKILEEMAQNLYREWFVKFRFPGHQHARFIDSPLGQIPEDWVVVALSELVTTQYGYTESTQEKPIGPKYLRGMDINKATYIDWNAVPYCPISDEQFPKYRLDEGDIVIIRMADPGKVGIVEKDVEAVFASYLVRLSRKTNFIGPYYLFYFLIDERYQGYITGASTGTTRKSASAGVLTGIDILVPPDQLLNDFELQIQAIRHLLNNLLERNNTLRRTRDLLLPKLISGEVDVSELDITVPGEAEA